MMLCVQKRIIFEEFNCGEVLQLTFLPKRNNKNCYIIGPKLRRALLLKKTSIKTMYLHQNEATFALKFEPWILDTANSLSQVHGYQKITFGDGATLKTENTLQRKKTWNTCT